MHTVHGTTCTLCTAQKRQKAVAAAKFLAHSARYRDAGLLHSVAPFARTTAARLLVSTRGPARRAPARATWQEDAASRAPLAAQCDARCHSSFVKKKYVTTPIAVNTPTMMHTCCSRHQSHSPAPARRFLLLLFSPATLISESEAVSSPWKAAGFAWDGCVGLPPPPPAAPLPLPPPAPRPSSSPPIDEKDVARNIAPCSSLAPGIERTDKVSSTQYGLRLRKCFLRAARRPTA